MTAKQRQMLLIGGGAAVGAALVALAVFAISSLLQYGQSSRIAAQYETGIKAVATQMTTMQQRLLIYDMTLGMRVQRGALTPAGFTKALLEREHALEANDRGDAPLLAEQRAEAEVYFQAIDASIARSAHWPLDKPADKYREIAISVINQARQDYDKEVQAGSKPTLALDEASAVFALTVGTIISPDAETPFDGAHDDVAAFVRDLTLGKPATAGSDYQPFAGGVPSGYALSRPTTAEPAGAVPDSTVPTSDEYQYLLGDAWEEDIGGNGKGVWSRRPGSDTFDVTYTGTDGVTRLTTVNTVGILGNKVTAQRVESSDGDLCSYTGTYSGGTLGAGEISGTKTCASGVSKFHAIVTL